MPLRLLTIALLIYLVYTWLSSLWRQLSGSGRESAPRFDAAQAPKANPQACPFCGREWPAGAATGRCMSCGTVFQEGDYRL